MVFEVKFNAEVQGKEQMKIDFEEKIEQMNIMHNKEIEKEKKITVEKELQRQESELLLLKEKELKEKALKLAETAEKTITEQAEQIMIAQNDVRIKQNQFEIQKQKADQEFQKANDEQKRRNEAEILKGEIEGEIFNLKRENERIQYENGRLKEKFGEEKFDEEKQTIEMKEKEKEEEIQRLKEENENEQQRVNNAEQRILIVELEKQREINEKNKQNKRANEAEERIKRLEQEKQKEIQEKQRLNQILEKEIQEKNQQKRRANEAEERLKRLEQEKNKEKYEKDRQYIRAEEAEGRIRRLEEEMQMEKAEKLKKDQELKNQRDEIEKIKINIPQDLPIAIINPDPTQINIVDVDGRQKKIIIQKNQHIGMVSLTQVLENGIWELEVQFSNKGQTGGIGIVKDSFIIPTGSSIDFSPHQDKMASYHGLGYGYCIYHKGISTSGNKLFTDDQIIKTEYDSKKGSLIFFVDGVQQPVYISGIKEKIRFIVFMYYAGATCTIHSLKKLPNPTSGHVPNENAVQW
ncbi:MAG: hypothetical protein EZS28_027830 [Streblomastix strix]|uniref:B30.2/SPRY domain-containing protein n=1 Tax=Streblomastix strix TaxID=222440 RepID=A0A5J4V2F9_9EUKA|nr:MAG: hypothetical protein EZS28_027830 [Streblomastix strix]